VTGALHLKSAMARRAAFEGAMQEIGLSVPAEMIVVAITRWKVGYGRWRNWQYCASGQRPSCARTT